MMYIRETGERVVLILILDFRSVGRGEGVVRPVRWSRLEAVLYLSGNFLSPSVSFKGLGRRPRSPACGVSPIMTGIIPQSILFEMTDGGCFPARLALAGECDFLMDRDGAVFNEQAQTFELLIKVFDLFPSSISSI